MSDTYEWYRKALAGEKPMVTTEPECGFFLAKWQGKLLPGRIFYHGPIDEFGDPCGDETMRCLIGGVECDLYEGWLMLAKRVIPQDEYERRMMEMWYEPAETF